MLGIYTPPALRKLNKMHNIASIKWALNTELPLSYQTSNIHTTCIIGTECCVCVLPLEGQGLAA